MGSKNLVILLGRLGSDPEVKSMNNGGSVCNFSLATSERFKSGDEWQEKTEWHRCVMFGKRAEAVGQYLSKGKEVYCEGRLQTRSWEDKDGNKKYSTEVVVNDVQFVGGNGGGAGQSEPQTSSDIPF